MNWRYWTKKEIKYYVDLLEELNRWESKEIIQQPYEIGKSEINCDARLEN